MSPFAKFLLPRDRRPAPRRLSSPRGESGGRASQAAAVRAARTRPLAAWPLRGGRLRE